MRPYRRRGLGMSEVRSSRSRAVGLSDAPGEDPFAQGLRRADPARKTRLRPPQAGVIPVLAIVMSTTRRGECAFSRQRLPAPFVTSWISVLHNYVQTCHRASTGWGRHAWGATSLPAGRQFPVRAVPISAPAAATPLRYAITSTYVPRITRIHAPHSTPRDNPAPSL